MSGNKFGIVQTSIIGCRVSTHLDQDPKRCVYMDYTPAVLRAGDGKKTNARLSIPVMVNLYGQEKPHSYKIVTWGKLADAFSRHLNRGKEMTFICEPNHYLTEVRSRVDGNIIMDKDGQPALKTLTSYRIINFTYGQDSHSTVTEEIQFGIVTGEGFRPANWNNPTHADNGIWKQMLAARNNTYFSPEHEQRGFFGFARVVMPRTPGYTVLYGAQYDKEPVIYNAAGAAAVQNVVQNQAVQQPPVQQTIMQPVTQTAPLVNQVQNTLNPNTQQPVMQQPIVMQQHVPQQGAHAASRPGPGYAPF